MPGSALLLLRLLLSAILVGVGLRFGWQGMSRQCSPPSSSPYSG